MENKRNLYEYLYILFWICFGMMLFAIFAVRHTDSVSFFRIEVIGLLLLILIFCQKVKIKKFVLWLFVGSFLLRLIVVVIWKTEAYSDFKVLYDAAQALLTGDMSFSKLEYFQYWPYQIGFVIWESLLLRICNSVLFLKVTNCLMGAGISILIYGILKELHISEKAAKFSAIAYALFPFSIIHMTILSNSHSSAFFLFLGLYFWVKDIKSGLKKKRDYVYAGVFIAIGNILRPDGLIILVAIAVYLIFTLLQNFNKESCIKVIYKTVGFFGTYFGVMIAVSTLIILLGISPFGLKNNNPMWKFVEGFNHGTQGAYSQEDDIQFLTGKIENGKYLAKEQEIAVVKDRISDPIKVVNLFMAKINKLWWNDAIYWSVSDTINAEYPQIVEMIRNFNRTWWYGIMLLVVVGVKKWISYAKNQTQFLLIPFTIFATFTVYLLIEVQSRYAYLVQIAVFIMAAGGVSAIYDKWDEYKKLKNA